VGELGAGVVLAPDAPPEETRSALEHLTVALGFREAAAAAAGRIAAEQSEQSALHAVEVVSNRSPRDGT
jgi:hypothetical protein